MFFFFNDTATTEIYTLSLHDALPICAVSMSSPDSWPTSSGSIGLSCGPYRWPIRLYELRALRSEEHTSELQSRQYLVCRLLLEKKKKQFYILNTMFED